MTAKDKLWLDSKNVVTKLRNLDFFFIVYSEVVNEVFSAENIT